jgi:hypothetical protein
MFHSSENAVVLAKLSLKALARSASRRIADVAQPAGNVDIGR